jgi:hypothetical protein
LTLKIGLSNKMGEEEIKLVLHKEANIVNRKNGTFCCVYILGCVQQGQFESVKPADTTLAIFKISLDSTVHIQLVD